MAVPLAPAQETSPTAAPTVAPTPAPPAESRPDAPALRAPTPRTAAPPTYVVPSALNSAYAPQPAMSIRIDGTPLWPVDEIAQQASTTLQIDYDGDIAGTAGLAANGAVAILTSTAVRDSAAESVLKFSSEQARDGVAILGYPIGHRLLRVEVWLRNVADKAFSPGSAEKVLVVATQRLRESLAESAQATAKFQAERAQNLQNQSADANARLTEVRRQLADLRAAEREIPAKYRTPQMGMEMIEQERDRLMATRSQLQERLDGLRPVNQQSSEWQKLIELREQRLAELMESKAPASEQKEAELKLAEARAQRASADNNRGRDSQRPSNENEIRRTEVELAKQTAALERLNAVQKQIEAPAFLGRADQMRQLVVRENQIQQEVAMLTGQFDSLRHGRRQEPRYQITVLDGMPDPR